MAGEEMKLQISDKLGELLEERHISADEVNKVIAYAEAQGKKLYQPEADRYLAKLRIGNATFYVEYSIGDDQYVVRSAYAHKAEMVV